ncbi:DUF3301 domain-containing protein [Pelagibaculum spongiae]|uniref:DUF3301 domain-containing protein n=1 Tax=Pelagibaculum spongiae TaxID=2080658 RepID=UPI001313E94E|nr:DUF3301 domain-containing protein [Pelagibaculum spongiae]
MSLLEVLVLFVVAGFVGFIWKSIAIKDHAVYLAKQVCNKENLQLLNATVSQQRCWIQRDQKSGRLMFGRLYEFEFSGDGQERRKGWMTMGGMALESIHLEPWKEGYIPPKAGGSPFS